MAMLVLGEIPRLAQLGGMGIILVGIAMLFEMPERGAARDRAAMGAMGLAVLGAFIRGAIQPIVKTGLETWPSPFAAVLIGYIVSTLVIIAAGALSEGANLFRLGSGRAVFLAVGVSNGMGMLCMYAALAEGEVAMVAPIIACFPMAAILFSWLLLGQSSFSPRVMFAAAVTIFGIVVLVRA